MSRLNILVVTRNRLSGIIDSLSSIKRLSSFLNCSTVELQVTIQDNSDYTLSESILRYYRKYFPIDYHKTSVILPMSRNWNDGLAQVLNQNPDYIAVLADRRLVSANLLSAINYLDAFCSPFICFDHQEVWINATTITKRKHQYNVQDVNRPKLLSAIGSAQIDWHYPMLFNCVISGPFMLELFNRYGSYAEGSSPDMNFLARTADMGIEKYYVYDAPCIVTNARHASTSNGSSALISGTIHSTEHARLSGIESYPLYMENYVTANITGSLARYWSDYHMRKLIDASGFFRSSLLELSYPKSAEAFLDMKEALLRFTYEFNLNSDARTLVDSMRNTPSAKQQYPINSNCDLMNTPSLDLLSEVERALIL